MNYIKSTILTEAAHALIAKNQANGTSPTFTVAKVGAGVYTDADTDDVIEQLTDLRDPRQTFQLSGVEVRNKTNIYISFVATNHDENQTLTDTTYPMLEIGIYAIDPDTEEEILYAVAIADTEHPDWMPTYNGVLPALITYHIMIEVANADNVVLQAGGGAYALADDLETLRQQLAELQSTLGDLTAGALDTINERVERLITAGTVEIPQRAWRVTDEGAAVHIPIPDATESHVPHVVVSESAAGDVLAAGMELICSADDGTVTITADEMPANDVTVSLTLVERTQPVTTAWPVGINVDPKTYTWQNWKDIIESGETNTYIRPGDATRLTPLNGTMGGVEFDDYNVRFRVMHIDNEDRPIFMLWENEDGVPIALDDTDNSSHYVEANGTGICMNRKGQVGTEEPDSTLSEAAINYGPNKGGWASSYCRGVLMPEAKLLLPEELRELIIPTTVWTDNVGNNTDEAENITQTTDELLLPGEIELFGQTFFSNTYTSLHQTQWDWCKTGISLMAFKASVPSEDARWFERDPNCKNTNGYCCLYTDKSSQYPPAVRYAIRFCFRI